MNVWFSSEAPAIEGAEKIKLVGVLAAAVILLTGLFPDLIRFLLEVI